MKKRMMLLLTLVLISSFSMTYAGVLEEPIIEIIEIKENEFQAKHIPYTETYYSESRGVASYRWDWTHEHENGTGLVDTVSYAVTRTKFWNASASAEAEAGVIFSKVGFSAEIGFGGSKDVNTTATFQCKPNGVTNLYYGSKVYETSGNIYEYNKGRLVRTVYVFTDFSYKSASKTE